MRAGPLVLLVAALAAGPAWAAKKSTSKAARRYGVLTTGPSAEAASKAAISALKGIKVPDNRLQEEAQKYGVALGTDQAYLALSLSMKLDAVVRVTTLDKGTSQIAVVQVRDGSTGAIVDDATWKASSGKALGQTLSKQLKPRFQKSLAGTQPAAPRLAPAGARLPPGWPRWRRRAPRRAAAAAASLPGLGGSPSRRCRPGPRHRSRRRAPPRSIRGWWAAPRRAPRASSRGARCSTSRPGPGSSAGTSPTTRTSTSRSSATRSGRASPRR